MGKTKQQLKWERVLKSNHFAPKQSACIVKLLNDIKQDVLDDTFGQTVYLIIGLMDITLWNVYGWRHKRIRDYNEALGVLLSEVDRKLMTPDDVVDWAEELTGLNLVLQLKEIENDKE